MAKAKNLKMETFGEDNSYVKITEVKEPEEVEVTSIAEAEKLQEEGWQQIDCHSTPEGKIFKYRKVNK